MGVLMPREERVRICSRYKEIGVMGKGKYWNSLGNEWVYNVDGSIILHLCKGLFNIFVLSDMCSCGTEIPLILKLHRIKY